MRPVIWGVISTAKIGVNRVIPAMLASELCDVRAIASRNGIRARDTAAALNINRHYDSYEALLADDEVEAIYNPLPNHLHVDWSIQALEAGKHVLCEKPIACRAHEVQPLIDKRNATGLMVEEAFMVRDHPQWRRLREIIDEGRIGPVRNVQLSYSHYSDDPKDIRNQSADGGGGGLLDVGCYCVTLARLIYNTEPLRAMSLPDIDPRFGIDRSNTVILEFPEGHASFFCSMQSSRYQMIQIIGTKGWIRIEVPFAHPADLAARLVIGRHEIPGTEACDTIHFEPVDQYRLQAERFSRQIRNSQASAWPLETALSNMQVLDAIRTSAETGNWASVVH